MPGQGIKEYQCRHLCEIDSNPFGGMAGNSSGTLYLDMVTRSKLLSHTLILSQLFPFSIVRVDRFVEASRLPR